MGRRRKTAQTTHRGHDQGTAALSEQAQAQQIRLITTLWAILRRLGGGGLEQLFAPIQDPRDQKRIDYPLPALFFVALLMYVCGLGARRCIKSSLNVPLVCAKMKALGAPGVPHGDTVGALCALVQPLEVQELTSTAVERLLRSRLFEPYRLLASDYLIVFDGSWHLKFKEAHASNHLTQTHADKTTYYYMVLEAKLVTPNGLAFSLMTEFVENVAPNASKQDCESKACLRLMARLKKRFPRLPITLLLDGLFARGPVFEACCVYGWRFFATLTDNDLPSVHEEMKALAPLQATQQAQRIVTNGGTTITQAVSWVTAIAYVDSAQRQHTLNTITCKETSVTAPRRPRRNKRGYAADGTLVAPSPVSSTTTFAWVTNHVVTHKYIWALIEAARRRWKIENEGFNEQKNCGDLKLTHAYSYHPNAVKVLYLILQLAHMIMQLMHKSLLLDDLTLKGSSMRELAKNMREAWRNVWCIDGLFASQPRFQIRFLPIPDTG